MLFSVLSSAGGGSRCVRDGAAVRPRGAWRRPARKARWLLAKQRQPCTPAPPAGAPQRPALQEVSSIILLGRGGEIEDRPRLLEALQGKVHALAAAVRGPPPPCGPCGRPRKREETESVSWPA